MLSLVDKPSILIVPLMAGVYQVGVYKFAMNSSPGAYLFASNVALFEHEYGIK